MIDSFPKPETPNSSEQWLEHIPTAEEVYKVFKRLTGKECKETLKTEDELGLYILRVETPGNNPGDVDEYEYRRKKKFTADERSKTEITVTYYSDGMPMSGQDVAKYILNQWLIFIETYPGVSTEALQTLNLSEISYDIRHATAEQRKTIIGRIVSERNEEWITQALDIDQPFSAEEIEVIITIITDPYLSFRILTTDPITGNRLNHEQKEKLMTQIESDMNVAELFMLQLVESGVAEEPNETEKWWLERLRKLLE